MDSLGEANVTFYPTKFVSWKLSLSRDGVAIFFEHLVLGWRW